MIAAEVWSAISERLSAGERVFVAVVADHTRHSPGTRGATLALCGDGPPLGTIGGGGMEADVLKLGRERLEQRSTAVQVISLTHRKEARGARSGLICAGRQTNLYAVLDPERHAPALQEAVERIKADLDGVLSIGLDGYLSVLDEEARPERPPVRVLPDRVELQLLRQDRVAIYGGGHCGLALSRQLAWLDYHVTVAEVRPDLFTLHANTFADRVVTGAAFADLAEQVRYPAVTCAVVMTSDLGSDVQALCGVLRQPFPFVGVMGAPAKLAQIRKQLSDQGFGDRDLARIVAPIGLPIGSSRPEEIAVSVAAQLLSLRPTLFPGRAPSPFAEVTE